MSAYCSKRLDALARHFAAHSQTERGLAKSPLDPIIGSSSWQGRAVVALPSLFEALARRRGRCEAKDSGSGGLLMQFGKSRSEQRHPAMAGNWNVFHR